MVFQRIGDSEVGEREVGVFPIRATAHSRCGETPCGEWHVVYRPIDLPIFLPLFLPSLSNVLPYSLPDFISRVAFEANSLIVNAVPKGVKPAADLAVFRNSRFSLAFFFASTVVFDCLLFILTPPLFFMAEDRW